MNIPSIFLDSNDGKWNVNDRQKRREIPHFADGIFGPVFVCNGASASLLYEGGSLAIA